MHESPDSTLVIYRVAVRFPPFWPGRPGLWCTKAEAQFELATITNERTKFVTSHHITTGLLTRGGGRRRHYFPLGKRALSDTEDGVSAAIVHFSRPTCSPTPYAPGGGWSKISSFFGILRVSHLMYQTSSYGAYGPAGSPRTSKPYLPARLRTTWLQPPNWQPGLVRSLTSPPLWPSPHPATKPA
jgi:hypothetical protein